MRRFMLLLIQAANSLSLTGDGNTIFTHNVSGGDIVSMPWRRRDIPDKVLIGYASHAFDNVREAVMGDGVNIIVWSFIDILASEDVHVDDGDADFYHWDGELFSSSHRFLTKRENMLSTRTARMRTGLNLDKIKSLIEELDGNGYTHVLHLVSFGGWNGRHLDPSLDAQEWYLVWKRSLASSIFHGIDWDLEGNDARNSPENVFTIECLDKMGEISRLMKRDGYIVTMAPPQSYLNFEISDFSRYVNLTLPGRGWHEDFGYSGRNVYAHLLAKSGDYIDLVSVQLYESYSDAAMAVYHNGMTAGDYLFSFIRNLAMKNQSFRVDFSQDPNLGMAGRWVEVPLSKLVVGLANGWALGDSSQSKVFYISPEDCEGVYVRLRDDSDNGDLTPRGFMFWSIEDRGMRGVYLAAGIGKFLHGERDK